jgi:hypothetical protein
MIMFIIGLIVALCFWRWVFRNVKTAQINLARTAEAATWPEEVKQAFYDKAQQLREAQSSPTESAGANRLSARR